MGADQTMTMHPQDSVPIPGKSRVKFEPGALHIMLVNLQQDLREGETFELGLNFQTAGEIVVEVPVEQR
jgi:copper(I)-binding protein